MLFCGRLSKLNKKQIMEKLGKKIIIWVALIGAWLTQVRSVYAQAQAVEPGRWTGVCVGGADQDVATIQGLECLIANVFMVFLTILGLAGFVMFLVGSFRWLVSGGNTKGTETARNTMTFAVIGIVLALSAFIILSLISQFIGIDELMEFRIPTSDGV